MTPRSDITLFARTNGRAPQRVFGSSVVDRLGHTYIVGRTGSGKSSLIHTLIRSDIAAGRACVLIDPHGDLARAVVEEAPPEAKDRLRYWNVADSAQSYLYNPLRKVQRPLIPLAASGLLEALKLRWSDAWGVRMEHFLRHALYALIEYGDATLPDISRLFHDRAFRREVMGKVQNEQVRTFFLVEYPKLSPFYRRDALAPIENKIGALLADPRLYRLFTSAPEDLSLRRSLDEGVALIVNLDKGRLGSDSAYLLGALLLATLGVAAVSRSGLLEGDRHPAFIYVDEVHHFATEAIGSLITDLRKYQVGLVLANQHLAQLSPSVRAAVLGNAGTLIAFRVGADDAATLAAEFAPGVAPLDLLCLGRHEVLLRLQIDGTPSRAFSATTLPPPRLHH